VRRGKRRPGDHIRIMEASMQGSFKQSPPPNQSIYRNWNIKLVALPVLLAIALIGYAVSHPDVSKWIAEAVQAEFAGTDLTPNLAFDRELDVNQPARMVHIRLRHQQGEILASERSQHL
jgi:hypothetical protein